MTPCSRHMIGNPINLRNNTGRCRERAAREIESQREIERYREGERKEKG